MAQTYTTEGIILKRKDYQENDRLFTIYSKDYGKLDLLAKGTKKISSKLNSFLEPFYLVKLMIAKGKGFDKLANCNLVNAYPNLHNNLNAYYLLSYLAETTDGLIVGQTEKHDKYNLLLEILDILEKEINELSKEKLLLLLNIYNLKLLNLLGYQPEIQRCLMCHKGLLLTKNIFDFSQGGIICEDCKNVCLITDYIIVTDNVIKLLKLAQKDDLKSFIKIKIQLQDIKLFNQVIFKLLEVNLEKQLKTVSVLI